MNLIVTIDENNGMLFNKRRQSRDRELIRKIMDMIGEKKLWMNTYSSSLFYEFSDRITVSDDFLSEAADDDWCFAETSDITQYEDRIQELLVCCWNRKYPSDTKFEMDLSGWEAVTSEEIAGYSHEKITISRYAKESRWLDEEI